MTNHVPEATKPASGDYAWLGAEAGSVADLMYMLNTEDWYDAINSRFVSELLDDTLPESILKAYLIQDFKFYNNGMMARLIKLAPRQETKDMLAAQSQWFADNEATYFEHFLEAYHVSQEEYDATEPTPANKEYGIPRQPVRQELAGIDHRDLLHGMAVPRMGQAHRRRRRHPAGAGAQGLGRPA